MSNKHDWQTQMFYDEFVGFTCSKCELFIRGNANPHPINGCEGDLSPYSTMSQQDIRRELSGTEFWNEDKGDR